MENKIKWIHIMDRQPDHEESIIHIDAPYEGHYPMGMRDYQQNCTFEEVLQYLKLYKLPPPNFWWVRSKDFPFPKAEKEPILP